MPSNQECLRSRVYNFYQTNISHGKSYTVRHFLAEGVPRSTIYDILERFSSGLGSERRPGTGRIPHILTKTKLKRLESTFKDKDGVSIRTAARKMNASVGLVHWALRTKLGIKYRRKQAIPARNDNQIALAKTKCGRLMRKFRHHSFILDDESFFTLSHSRINGNGGYYTSDPSSTPADVKFVRKKKFEEKALVWIAIGPRGLSRPFIRKSGYAINAQRYLDECIQRRLIPYINTNYSNKPYVFWPDQASAHYAGIVTEHLAQEKINLVAKKDNPANVPEVRCIEDFWSYLKSLVYAKGWKAANTDQLITRIKYCLKKVDATVVQKLAEGTKKRIDIVRRHGVIESRE